MSLASRLQPVVEDLLPGATVVRTRRLKGGIATTCHLVSLTRGGEHRDVVLKRYEGGLWEDRPEVALHVHALLARLLHLPVPAPEPLWSDSGEVLGVAALITTRIQGRMRFLPAFSETGIDQAAKALAAIHAAEVPEGVPLYRLAGAGPEPTPSGRVLVEKIRHEWGDDPLGGLVAEMLGNDEQPRDFVPVLCHGDFYPANLLWRGARLAAVLDWDAARIGCAAGDVAYCRIHLALTGPPGCHDVFVHAYESHAGLTLTDLPHWDARAAALAVGRHPFWMRVYEAGGLRLDYLDVRRRLEASVAACRAAMA